MHSWVTTALIGVLAASWAGAAVGQDRVLHASIADVAAAATCVRRALTEGLEPPEAWRTTPSELQRKAIAARLDRNAAKKTAAVRACVSEEQARQLGRVDTFLETIAGLCGLKASEHLSSPRDDIWGDTDLRNGAAKAYMGANFDGPFFEGQAAARQSLGNLGASSPGLSIACDGYANEFGPNGVIWAGLLVPSGQTPKAKTRARGQ